MKKIYGQTIEKEDCGSYWLIFTGEGEYIGSDEGGVAFTHCHDYIEACVDANADISEEMEDFERKMEEIAGKPGYRLISGIGGEALELAIKFGWLSADEASERIDECGNIDWPEEILPYPRVNDLNGYPIR